MGFFRRVPEEDPRSGEVKEAYSRFAAKGSCCPEGSGCCASTVSETEEKKAAEQDEAISGFGCGLPLRHARLKPGETVLDLGCGTGLECLAAAREVGLEGKVVGMDITEEMLELARRGALERGLRNVEFIRADMERVPLADESVDVVISNCSINLAVDKDMVFKEAYRVLKRGGRLVISDIVLTANLPQSMLDSREAYVSCISGADLKMDYIMRIAGAGFCGISVVESREFLKIDPGDKEMVAKFARSFGVPEQDFLESVGKVLSITLTARKD